MLIQKNVFLTNFYKFNAFIYEKKFLFAIEKKFFSKLFFSQYCNMKFEIKKIAK